MICYLVRHGKDDTSRRGGWSDAALSAEGVQQIRQLAERLAACPQLCISRIFTSDLPRAKQSADILAAALGLTAEELPQFREADNGLLAGMSNDLAAKRYPLLYWNTLAWDENYPGGESPQQFFRRITDAWSELKERLRAEQQNTLLVTHSGVMEVIRCIEAGIPYTNKRSSFAAAYAEAAAVEITEAE